MVAPSTTSLRPAWPEWKAYEFNEATWAILSLQVFTRTWVQRQILQIRPPESKPERPKKASPPSPASTGSPGSLDVLLASIQEQNTQIQGAIEEMDYQRRLGEAHQVLELTPTPEWSPFVLNGAPEMNRFQSYMEEDEPSDIPPPPKADLLMVLLPAVDLQDFYRQSEQALSFVRGNWDNGQFCPIPGSSFMLHQPQLKVLAGTFLEDPGLFLDWLSEKDGLDDPEASWAPEEVCLAQFREAYLASREDGRLLRPILMPRFPYPSTSGTGIPML